MVEITSDIQKIDYGASGNAAVIQNAKFLLSSLIDTCPLDRQFGLNPPLDDPGQIASMQLAPEILAKFQEYIPELNILDISISQDNGKLKAVIKVELKDD
ncbi:hypothetical protein HMPREF1013_00828 [Bacillus sp. 2_A_57_CT2]|nr:hypothetical protein HMPREF1013_00828 [Bacillus sp. 2_A_57_CT2]